MYTYKTILEPAEDVYKIKGSRFLAFAHPVGTVDEVKSIVKSYKSKFFDARHVCYAYVLGATRLEFRSNDDGEPSGTAGKPILGQINSRELTNVLMVVVRYFGGTLLGTGGLISAYKEATSSALNNAEIVELELEDVISIKFDYAQMNEVMRVVKDANVKILSQQFENECEMQLSYGKAIAPIIKSKLTTIVGLKFSE